MARTFCPGSGAGRGSSAAPRRTARRLPRKRPVRRPGARSPRAPPSTGSRSPRCGRGGPPVLDELRQRQARNLAAQPDRTTTGRPRACDDEVREVLERARMFRPSRPMIRPFMSSEEAPVTVVSAARHAADASTRLRAALRSSIRTRRARSWRTSSGGGGGGGGCGPEIEGGLLRAVQPQLVLERANAFAIRHALVAAKGHLERARRSTSSFASDRLTAIADSASISRTQLDRLLAAPRSALRGGRPPPRARRPRLELPPDAPGLAPTRPRPARIAPPTIQAATPIMISTAKRKELGVEMSCPPSCRQGCPRSRSAVDAHVRARHRAPPYLCGSLRWSIRVGCRSRFSQRGMRFGKACRKNVQMEPERMVAPITCRTQLRNPCGQPALRAAGGQERPARSCSGRPAPLTPSSESLGATAASPYPAGEPLRQVAAARARAAAFRRHRRGSRSVPGSQSRRPPARGRRRPGRCRTAACDRSRCVNARVAV